MLEHNQLRLPSGKLITFNQEQTDGLDKILEWLKTPARKERFFTLMGYAGTGKTTIIKKVLDSYKRGVAVSAPTHKAKKVIMRTTGKDGQTLHGLLGLRPDVDLSDFNPNSPKFNPIAIPKISDYNFVIIDEASMINQELYNLIIEKTEFTNTKILFMGDPAQIPPVGEKESIVFIQDNIDKYELTKIERQNDTNPLTFIYSDLRNNLNKINGGFERKTNIIKVNGVEEGAIFTTDKRLFRKKIFEAYESEEFKLDIEYVKVIAWKNKTIIAANQIIRKKLQGKDADIIEVGDIIMGYRSITDESRMENIIENSADYRVVEKNDLSENSFGVKGYNIKLREDLNKGEFKFIDVFIVNTRDRENRELYAQMHDFFRDMGKMNKKDWKKYYNFRRHNLIMEKIDTYRDGSYRQTFDVIVKDIDYAYAITGHKSQGSTYDHVFVMENDINDNWVMKERNRIKYVSFTRPRYTATILTTNLD